MDESEKILNNLSTLKCDFSSLKSGNLEDIQKLYTCTKCSTVNIHGFTFRWTEKKPRIYKVCDKCKFEELL